MKNLEKTVNLQILLNDYKKHISTIIISLLTVLFNYNNVFDIFFYIAFNYHNSWSNKLYFIII